jgi:reactive intermediate/imine deaminase
MARQFIGSPPVPSRQTRDTGATGRAGQACARGRDSMDGEPMYSDSVSYVNPPSMSPPGGHYSHATVANGFAFVSGQLPITPQGEKLTHASFEAQAQQVLANVQAALEAAGSGVQQLVQVRVYVDDIANWPAFNNVYQRWAGGATPARAVVPVSGLHHGFKVEVEAVGLVQTKTVEY